MSEANKTGAIRGRAITTQPGFEDKLITTLGGESLEKV
jgi:hypothetical protein